jgi:hypothetical protein
MIVHVVLYEDHYCEEFEVKGVFSDENKAKRLLAEYQEHSEHNYRIEEWELNMTHLEKNIRGMIRNLEKQVAKEEASFGEMSTPEYIHAEVHVEELKKIIQRLEDAFHGTHAEDPEES